MKAAEDKCAKESKNIRQLHEKYIEQERCKRERRKKCLEDMQEKGKEKRERIQAENKKRIEEIEAERKRCLEEIEAANEARKEKLDAMGREHLDKVNEHIENNLILTMDSHNITAARGITISDNPYKAKLQRVATVLIWICRIVKFMLLAAGCYQIACICCDCFRLEPMMMKKAEQYNIFLQGMRDFTNIPGVMKLGVMHQRMISHFVMLLLTLGLLWIVRQLYGLLLNVATDGNPFTKEAIGSLYKICIPMLVMMFWNVPISVCLILFVLFISFIFEYGMYLQKKADETLNVQEDVILSFAEITEAKSGQTGKHVKRVSEYTKLLAEEMGLGAQKAEELRIASMMHDVGKLLIPSEILDKPGKLTDEEFAVIKKHTEFGEQLLANAHGDIMDTSRVVAKEHHEKWDGNGYAHVKGEDISIEGRIVAVADVYDALTSRRSYKDAWDDKAAYDEIVRCSGSHFDPAVVNAFIACYPRIKEIRAAYADS